MLGKTANNTRPARRNRRRLTAWIAFAAVGIIMGAVWATGFASIGGAQGTVNGSPAVTSGAAADHNSDLAGTASAVSATFPVDWTGRWGSIPTDTTFFKVDLTGKTGQTFNVAMLLSNDISAGGWGTIQLNVENIQKASGTADCSTAVYTGSTQNKVMVFDSQDAGVYWNGLAGDKVYCIGVQASNGQDTLGTFLRSGSDTPPTIYPTFITTVDRAS
jgi:hypothetical protein